MQVHVKQIREVEISLPVEHAQNAERDWKNILIIIPYGKPAASCELDQL